MTTFNPSFPASSFLGYPPFLTELSKNYSDHRFAVLKSDSLKVSELLALGSKYYNNPTLKKWSDRMSRCSPSLFLRPAESGLKLQESSFCKVRLCPMCSSRKSAMWKAKFLQIYPQLVAEHSNLRYLFLTLTIKNVLVSRLKDVLIKVLRPSIKRFFMSLSYRLGDIFQGKVRKFECTYSSEKHCHPHYHYILAVDPDYFDSDSYISFDSWVDLWQASLRADYKPSIRIKAISLDDEKGFLEVLKYELKPDDFKKDYKWLSQYGLEVSGTKIYSTSGLLRKYFSFLDYDPDMIHEADKEYNRSLGLSNNLIRFDYNDQARSYVLKN